MGRGTDRGPAARSNLVALPSGRGGSEFRKRLVRGINRESRDSSSSEDELRAAGTVNWRKVGEIFRGGSRAASDGVPAEIETIAGDRRSFDDRRPVGRQEIE